MTEVIHLKHYGTKSDRELPVVMIVEADDEYFEYFSEAMKCSGTRVVRVTDFDKARIYLQSRPAPAVLVFDYFAIGTQTTEAFVEWLNQQLKFQFTYMLLATGELYAESIVSSLGIHDWIPRNVSQDILSHHLVGASEYYKEERANN